MRQAVLILVLIAIVTLVGCGGGSSSSSNTPGSVTVSPATLSLNQGDVAGVVGTVLTSSGTAAVNPPAVTYTTSDATIATVTSAGAVCAGVWDSTFINCTPGAIGSATITATSGSLSSTATVYVHKKVDKVVISTPTSVCKSIGQTIQLAAQAFSNGVDVTSTVGPFSWGSNNSAVATIDTTGLLTAQAPGSVSLFAGVSHVTSIPTIYSTCAVRSIHVHAANAANTAFTLAVGGTQQLAVDVVDTAGNTINPSLTWVSVDPTIATVTSALPAASGLVAAVSPGTTTIVPECAINCNYNLPPVYGDVAVATVSGSSATTVYVTGTATTQLVPIDTGTNTAGTAVTLPSQPNSMVFLPAAGGAFLGSGGGAMKLDTAANAITQNTAFPGKVLAISPDSNWVLIADTNFVYVSNFGSGGATNTLSIAGATAAAFTPDSSHAYIVAGSTLYQFTINSNAPQASTLSAPAKDVVVSPSAAFAFVAGGAAHAIVAQSTCDNSGAGTFVTPGNPTRLAVTPDATKVLALDSPSIDILTRSSVAQPGCPPPLQATVSSVDLGQGAFVATQMVMSSDGAKVYIISDQPKVIIYDVKAGAPVAPIPLANGATGLAESLTLDGTKLYVGGSDNNVHRIDTVAGTDAQQISVSFTPNIVAVRPK